METGSHVAKIDVAAARRNTGSRKEIAAGLRHFELHSGQFCPTDPSETELMARFAKIGVGGGKKFDASKLSPEMTKAIEGGVADAWADFGSLRKQVELGKVTAGDVFGTREYLKNNYLYRMAAP